MLSTSGPAPAPSPSLSACERCGDYAELTEATGTRVCGACMARVPYVLTGEVQLGRALRDTLRLTRKAWAAALCLAPLTAVGLVGARLISALMPPASIAARLFEPAASTFLSLGAAVFMAASVVDEVAGMGVDLGRAARQTLRALPSLLAFIVLTLAPIALELALDDAPPPSGFSGGQTVAALLLIAGTFVPPLLVVRPPALLRALRDSPALLRSYLLVAVVGLGVLSGAAKVGELVIHALVTLVTLMFRDKLHFDQLSEVLAAGQPLTAVLAAPLYAFASVLRTLLVLQGRARGVVE